MPMLKIVIKTIILVSICLLALTALVVAWNFLLLGISKVFGIPSTYMKYVGWAMLAALVFMPKRFLRVRRPFTMSGTIDIKAPIDQVFQAIDYVPGHATYRKNFSEIREISGEPEKYELHFAVPKGDDEFDIHPIIIDVVSREAPRYLATYSSNDDDVGGLGIGSSAEEYILTETPDGTRVEIREVVSHTSFWLVITFLFVNPIKDTLLSLKHYCEGTVDQSWMAGAMENDSAITTQSFVAGVTVIAFLTGVALWLIWLAVRSGAI
ncbi:MAG: SRPBCC family protein [Boseongicola sp.]|nr:SRPBCC family protein [Boseongicola sp.]MDD9978126.1 SRPBCC family protein [Boseongicola sp.]